MGGISLDKAILISMILENLLHGSRPKSSSYCSITNKLGSGIFTVMFGFTLWVIIHERRGRINMRLLLPALALYAIATAVSHIMESILLIHLILDCVQAFHHNHICDYGGFHHISRYTRWPYGLCHQCIKCELPPQNFALRFTNSVGWLLLGKKILLFAITHRSVVHDAISQIYRCSVVWQHSIRIIILPILIWISCAGKWAILLVHNKRWRTCPNLVTGVGTLISFSKVSPEAQVFSIEGWITAFFAATLSTNVICTCTSSYWYPTIPFLDFAFAYSAMIAYRIWSVDRAGGKYRDSKSTLMPVLVVVIESGAIYSASLTILLAIYLSHSLAYFILVHAVSSFHIDTHHSSWTWIDNPNHCEIVHVVIWSIIWLTWCVGHCVQHDHCTGGPLRGLAKW